MCEVKDKEISSLKEKADELADYAVEIRYPDEAGVPTLDKAEDALEIAKKVKGFVLKRMTQL